MHNKTFLILFNATVIASSICKLYTSLNMRMSMTKERALKLFGGKDKLTAALKITRQAVEKWPQQGELSDRTKARVVMAALELGLIEWPKK